MVQEVGVDNTNKKEWLRRGNSFCPMPFLHYHVDTQKHKKLCCSADDIIESDSGFNTENYKDIRNKILRNQKINACKICYDLENKKQISPRQKNIKDTIPFDDLLQKQIADHTENIDLKPHWYDLRISNNCNLACIMCGPNSSSTIAKNLNISNSHLSYEPDIDINPNSFRIYLAGGEPFLIKKFVTLLDKITNLDCEIIVNTNGTITTKPMIDSLSRFKNVSITLSLDGYNEINSSIRKNSDWNTIDKNIDLFKSLGYGIHINTVVQKDNINHLYDLGMYIESKNIKLWSLGEVSHVDELLPTKQKINLGNIEKLMTLDIIKNNLQSVNLLKNIILETR